MFNNQNYGHLRTRYFNNGAVESWRYYLRSDGITLSKAWGSMWHETIDDAIRLTPSGEPGFVGTPDISVTPYGMSNNHMSFLLMCFGPHNGLSNVTNIPNNTYALCCASGSAKVTFALFIHAHGRWK